MRREGEVVSNVGDDRARWRITEAGKRHLLALINERGEHEQWCEECYVRKPPVRDQEGA